MNTTPIGVDRKGRLVWGDAAGNRDFSPTTQRRIRIAAALFLTAVLVATVVGLIAPAPWSPMGGA